MTLTLRTFFLATTLLAAAWTAASAAERVALVIGNDNYQHARKLNAAVNDAGAVAEALKRLGFDTISASNAGLEQMVEAMDLLQQKAAGARAVVVFYAGHGIESRGANYLVPVDAKLEKELQLQTQALNLNTVLDKLTDLNVPARMVILDCCRDNPLEGRAWLATRAIGSGGLGNLPQQSLPAATLVVYAASPGKPALDRVEINDRHSPFTTALLEELPRADTHSFEVFGRVEDAVIRRTEGRQEPRLFYNGSTQPFRNFQFAPAAFSPEGPLGGLAPVPMPPPVASVPETPPVVSVQEAPPAMPAPVATPAGNEPPAPVITLTLPSRGYFTASELFASSPYADYNDYSQTRILRMAQEKLKVMGYYSGTPDGVSGGGTQRAVIGWQEANGVAVTGRLDAATLEKLGLTGLAQMAAPSRPAPSSRPRPRPAADDFFRDT